MIGLAYDWKVRAEEAESKLKIMTAARDLAVKCREKETARAEKAEAERDVLIRHMSESPVCTDCTCPVARERGDSCPAVGMPIGGHDCEGHIRQWAEREAAKHAALKAMYPDVAETFDRLEREEKGKI